DPLAHAGSRQMLLGPDAGEDEIARLSMQNAVGPDTPPTFLFHALDDSAVPPENSMMMLNALRSHGIAAECHLVESGGHGFGMGRAHGPSSQWPELMARFAQRHFFPEHV
ncbi:prolyl oligopeptidase family serine peptidase, partial [Erythrobacter sp.]|uniref:alpha/beta hydrolase n=1 Tax=Erythrobacter sp. TaxID=1042 RepID=UPI00311DF5DD